MNAMIAEGPVKYVEKGIGLHDAIEASGHYLEERDGVWIGGGPDGPDFVQKLIYTYQQPQKPRWMTSAEFIRRIPIDRWDAINEARLKDMTLQRLKDMLMTGDTTNSGSVNLDSDELSQGLDYVIYLGLITTEQKSELLK